MGTGIELALVFIRGKKNYNKERGNKMKIQSKKNPIVRFFLIGLLALSTQIHAQSFESVGVDSEGREFSLQDEDMKSLFLDSNLKDSDSYRGNLADGVVLDESIFDDVHGNDDRKQVTDTTSFPNRTIGRMSVGCTGTLIGPRVVLTAAHCVYNLKKKEWYPNGEFSPGQNGSVKPYGSVKVTKAITTKAYTQDSKTEWDIAVLILDTPIGNQVGWMAYSYDDGLTSVSVNINGYPGDKPHGTMWHSYCPVKDVQTELFTYMCDTYEGNSGSATYRYIAATKERKIFGVHTNGLKQHNYGTRITKAKFDKLQKWKAENP